MSGESPRVTKLAVRPIGSGAERPYQATAKGAIGIARPTPPTSRQQLIVCAPLGQHGLCSVSAWLWVEEWQSDCIEGEIAANTKDPSRPRAINNIQAINWRFTGAM